MVVLRILVATFVLQFLVVFQAQSKTLEELKSIVDSSHDDKKKVDALNGLCEQLVQLSPSESVGYSEEALEICSRVGYLSGECRTYLIIAKAYTYMSAYTKAADNARKSLDLARKINDANHISLSLIQLGSIYREAGDYKGSNQYYAEALEILEEHSSTHQIAVYSNNMGSNYFKAGDIDKALEYYQATFDLCKKNNLPRGICLSKLNIGQVYLKTNKLDKAEQFLSEAYECCCTNKYYNYIIYCLLNLAKLASEKNEYVEAENLFQEALFLAQKDDFKKLLLEIYEEMSKCAVKTEKFEEALKYHKLAVTIKDSLNSAKTSLLLTESEYQFNRGKRFSEKSLQKEGSSDHSLLFYVTAMSLMISFLVIIFYLKKKNKNLAKHSSDRISAEAMPKSNQNAGSRNELGSIATSELISPKSEYGETGNILFNSKDHISKGDRDEHLSSMKKSADRSYELLNNLIEWTGTKKENFPFNPNIVDIDIVIKNNLKLFNLNIQKKNLKLYADIAENTFAKVDHYMITTIIRNLISNAVKYTPENGEIKIRTTMMDDTVRISVADSGIGIKENDLSGIFEYGKRSVQPDADNEKGAGLGLVVCKEFVEKHGGTIQAFSKEGRGAEFVFTVPSK